MLKVQDVSLLIVLCKQEEKSCRDVHGLFKNPTGFPSLMEHFYPLILLSPFIVETAKISAYSLSSSSNYFTMLIFQRCWANTFWQDFCLVCSICPGLWWEEGEETATLPPTAFCPLPQSVPTLSDFTACPPWGAGWAAPPPCWFGIFHGTCPRLWFALLFLQGCTNEQGGDFPVWILKTARFWKQSIEEVHIKLPKFIWHHLSTFQEKIAF